MNRVGNSRASVGQCHLAPIYNAAVGFGTTRHIRCASVCNGSWKVASMAEGYMSEVPATTDYLNVFSNGFNGRLSN